MGLDIRVDGARAEWDRDISRIEVMETSGQINIRR